MANFSERITIMVVLLSAYGTSITDASQYRWQTQLFKDLLSDYHKAALPIDDGPVVVGLGFSLLSFDFIDEANEKAQVHARLLKSWTDPRLKWDPADYNGTEAVLVDSNDVWLPDITMWNSGVLTETLDSDIWLYSSGYVLGVPQFQLDFTCPMDFRFFPYDKQVCELKFGSWHHHTANINVTFASKIEKAELLPYHHVRDFTVTKLTAEKNEMKYDCCPETYADITYGIHLERDSSAYSVKLVLPAVLTGFLVLATFLLPPASHEKITLCGLLFLSLLLQFSYLHDIVPASGDTILGEFLAFVLFIDFFATIIAVVSYHVQTKSQSSPRQQHSMIELEGDAHDLKIQMPRDRKRELLRYLDIVSFVIFTIIMVVGMAIILGRRG